MDNIPLEHPGLAGATIVVPDIHDQIEQLKKIDAQFGHLLPRIYLGDWTDSFNQKNDDRDATLRYWAKELQRPNRVFCWGNHDWHYGSLRKFVCSGYKLATQDAMGEILPGNWEDQFVFYHERHGWLLSHAGFNREPRTWDRETMPHAVGRCRGGTDAEGGPLWLDWRREFVGFTGESDVAYQPQIVGHTQQEFGPAMKYGGVCLDTGLRHVGLLFPTGELQIATITGKRKGQKS